MEPIDLAEGGVYQVTGTPELGTPVAEGEFLGQFESGVVVFRSLEKDPDVGFRTAWFAHWSEIARVDRGVPADDREPPDA